MKKLTDKQRQRIGKIGEVLLLSAATVGVVSVAVFAPNMLQVLGPLFKKKKYHPKRAVERNIDSLIKAGLLKRTLNDQGEVCLELTRRGKWEALLRGKSAKSSKSEKWDGFWRIVVFDVPNAKKNIRNELRRGIRLYGFYQLQKSVWVYPYECQDFIALLKTHLDIDTDILIMKVATLENDHQLKKEFKLS